MKCEKTVKIDGRNVKIRELLAREIEELYQNKDGSGIQMLSAFIRGDHEFVPAFLGKLTDLSLEEIREMTAVDYLALVEAVREVNADFFVTWGKEIERMMKKPTDSPSQKASAG
jgi:hypothetical protein